MKTARGQLSSRSALADAGAGGTYAELRGRVAAAEEALRAIRAGEVDAVVVASPQGDQVFTLQGAEHVYRLLVESMNEGALTLTADKTILFANQCFSKLVNRPLEQIIGTSFRRFLSAADRAQLLPLMARPSGPGEKIQVQLVARDGPPIPVQISVRPLEVLGLNRGTIGMVVTDMTESRRNEDLMQALAHRVVKGQETERGSVALELHDHITQLLCAILFRCQALVDELSARGGPSLQDAMRLREMLSETAGEVERISRNLRPGVLDQLGLVAVLRATSAEFEVRTGVELKLTCTKFTAQLPPDAELALYRVLQEALKNVETHAHARHVIVDLTEPGNAVQLKIRDDGNGFDPAHLPAGRKGRSGLGLLGMRERATAVGGTFRLTSKRGDGTEITVNIPLVSLPLWKPVGGLAAGMEPLLPAVPLDPVPPASAIPAVKKKAARPRLAARGAAPEPSRSSPTAAFPVIALDRPTSRDFSRPESALETGEVDFIRPLDEIASKSMELVGAGRKPMRSRTGTKRK